MSTSVVSMNFGDVIEQAFLKGRGKEAFGNFKALKKESERIKVWFEERYGGENRTPEYNRFLCKPVNEIIQNKDAFIIDVLAGIRSMERDKYMHVVRIEHVIKYLNDQYSAEISTDSFEYMRWKDREDRLLMILKYLHSGSNKREDIARALGISERTLADDISVLKNGFEFMGTQMFVYEDIGKKDTYISPAHPIFLALNSAEIYALTLGIKLLSKGTIFEHALSRISDSVHQQLTDFGRDMIKNLLEANETGFDCNRSYFMNSFELSQLYDKPFCQYLKSRKQCKILYYDHGEVKNVVGTLELSKDEVDRFKKIVVRTDDGDVQMMVSDIVSIMECVE